MSDSKTGAGTGASRADREGRPAGPNGWQGGSGGSAPRTNTARDGRPGPRVTLQDVADRAGVSITTASRVVNDGSRRVGARLAQRVHRAVAELGYTANLQARAVATGRSSMVGVVVHDIADPYFSSIAAGLIEVADTSSACPARRPARPPSASTSR